MQRTKATPRLQIVRASRPQNLYCRKLAARSCDIFSLCSSKSLYSTAMHWNAAQESVYVAAPTYVGAVQPEAKLFSTTYTCILKLWMALLPSKQASHRADLLDRSRQLFLATPVFAWARVSVSGRTQTFCQPGGRTYFCHLLPAAGSGRTYGCLFGKHPKSCCKQQGRQHRAPQVLAQWF